jgi:hypothetical protein
MHDVSMQDLKNAAQVVAEQMPEFLALQKRLLAETRQVRRAVVNIPSDWAYHPTTGMSLKEKLAFIEECKAELRRRGEVVDWPKSFPRDSFPPYLRDGRRSS